MSITVRSMFIEELQAHREQKGLTQEILAQEANISLSLLKKIEIGNRRPQRDFALWCDTFFDLPGTFQRLHRLTLLEMFPEWFASRMVYEEAATVITEWEMRVVPGLLQTRAYAEAVIRNDRPFATDAQRTRDIEARIERQQLLDRDNPPQLWVVLAEGPLHQLTGGREVMKSQLDHLIAMADSPKCVLQVLPFTVTDAPIPSGPATFFEFRDNPPVAYLEGWGAGWVVDEPKQVADISARLTMIKGCALDPGESKSLIEKIRSEL